MTEFQLHGTPYVMTICHPSFAPIKENYVFKRLFLALFLLGINPLFAETPPQLPKVPAPLFGGVVPELRPFPPAAPVRKAPITKPQLDALGVSGAPYYVTLAEIERGERGMGQSAPSAVTPTHPTDFALHKRGLRQKSDAVGGWVEYTRNMTVDYDPSDQFVEPSITTINVGGVDSTVIAPTRMTGPGNPISRNYFVRTPDLINVTNRGELPMPAGYVHSADPYLAINPYTGGDSPQTIWASGIVHNTVGAVPSAIALWRSVNGGLSWGVTFVAINSTDTRYFLDKPDLGVNWNSGYLGRVYVAYTRVDLQGAGGSEIHVARVRTTLVNGVPTVTVDSDIVIVTGYFEFPQVVVSRLGRIFVIYSAPGARIFRMATVLDDLSGSGPLRLDSTENIFSTRDFVDFSTPLNGGVRAATVPIARLNWALNRIELVWHEREPGSTFAAPRADVWYVSKQLDGADGGTWGAPTPIATTPCADEFHPALDAGSAGDVVITFLSRAVDPGTPPDCQTNNMRYLNYFVARPATGGMTSPAPVPDEYGSTYGYDPRSQPVQSGFLGDYQEVWNWTFAGTERWNSAWIKSDQSDTLMSGIR